MDKRILITFDYELFLGDKSGDISHCLIEPTNRLLDVFDTHQIRPAIFFVDTTYLIQLERQIHRHRAARDDYDAVTSQLADILKRGHILFPHLHPHWVDARYDPVKNEWSLTDYRYYRFHNLPDQQKEVLFEDSIRILSDIQEAADKHYPIEGYRAGGWSLMPFSDFKPYFEKYKIHYDFSVISRSSCHTTAQDYDYKEINGCNWYTFNGEFPLPAERGHFIEHPISTIVRSSRKASLDEFWLKMNWRLGAPAMGNGRGAHPELLESAGDESSNRKYLGIEHLSQASYVAFKQFVKRHEYIHFLSHPKLVSKVNLYCWNRLLSWIQKNYTVNYHYKVPEFELSEQQS